MLKKFLKVHKLNPFPRPKPPKSNSAEGKDSFCAILKLSMRVGT